MRELAQKLGSVVGTHASLKNLAFDWNEPARVVKIDVLQDKARQLGVSSQDIAMALNTVVQGDAVTQVRDDIYLVDVVGRAAAKEREFIDTLLDLHCRAAAASPSRCRRSQPSATSSNSRRSGAGTGFQPSRSRPGSPMRRSRRRL